MWPVWIQQSRKKPGVQIHLVRFLSKNSKHIEVIFILFPFLKFLPDNVYVPQ